MGVMQRKCELCGKRKPRFGFRMVLGKWRCPSCIRDRCFFCEGLLAEPNSNRKSGSVMLLPQQPKRCEEQMLRAHTACYYEAEEVEEA